MTRIAPSGVSCFVGLMSGTSLDGVDAVLAAAPSAGAGWQSQAHVRCEMPGPLRAELAALNHPGFDELHRAAVATQGLMALYARAVGELLRGAGVVPAQVRAIGAHGQTVRHRPPASPGATGGYTLQLMNGALLAELTGIDVVCDFRSRDLAAGGQGAPLVPAFHATRFARPGVDVAVLNLGGIANLSLLGADGSVRGFDCGPGNVLMDLWCQRHRGQAFDARGDWAAGGHIDEAWLQRLLAEPYFDRAPPKSTGRDLFDAEWLDARLAPPVPAPQDAMRTLLELTAISVVTALRTCAPGSTMLWVCGGGAGNTQLVARLQMLLGSACRVASTQEAGLAPDQVEALAFAWLAQAHLARAAGNVPAVTGAAGARVLGALYPAR